MRGSQFVGGYHDFRIWTGGLVVYPRLRLSSRPENLLTTSVSSGSNEMDALLGGGLALGREYLDRSIHDARSLSELELPILGEIPRIVPNV